VAILLNLKSC